MAKIHFNNETGAFIVEYTSGEMSEEIFSLGGLEDELIRAEQEGKVDPDEKHDFPDEFWINIYDEEGNHVGTAIIMTNPASQLDEVRADLKGTLEDQYKNHPDIVRLKEEEIMPCFRKCIGPSTIPHHHFYFDESSSDPIYSKDQAYAYLEEYYLNNIIEIGDKVRMELQIDKCSLPHSIMEN